MLISYIFANVSTFNRRSEQLEEASESLRQALDVNQTLADVHYGLIDFGTAKVAKVAVFDSTPFGQSHFAHSVRQPQSPVSTPNSEAKYLELRTELICSHSNRGIFHGV